jgi:hypothetical protein
MAGPLKDLKIHPCAVAYRKEKSILDNAKRHAGLGPILKMDFANFFPSITNLDWIKYCRETACLTDEDDVLATASLLFRQERRSGRLRLAIGAPSSPAISNALMFSFDDQISKIVAEDKVVYTRYADDLTFSAPRTGHLKDVVKNVRRVLKGLSHPKLSINEDKTVVATRKYRRNVTGLILANDGRVTIGRRRKRLLSAMVHRADSDLLTAEQLQYLAGYLAFASSIEPEFMSRLERRYGEALLFRIRRTVVLGKKVPANVRDVMILE